MAIIKQPVLADEVMALTGNNLDVFIGLETTTLVLVVVKHSRDAPGDGELIEAELEMLPEGSTQDDAMFNAVERSRNDTNIWRVYVAALVPFDGVDGKAATVAAAATLAAPAAKVVKP